MKFYVTLYVHRHYVKTVVREHFGTVDYKERCISAPSAAHLLYDVKNKYWEEPFFDYDEAFPTFPYPSYLMIRTIVDEDTRNVEVEDAVFSDNKSGVKHFADVFENAPQDLIIGALKNLTTLIKNKDVVKLLELVGTLTKASRHKTIKE